MVHLNVPKDTSLASALIHEVQTKVVGLGWVNEGDNTFAEYVVLSLDGGKDALEFTGELAEVLENAANVADFITWLADTIDKLSYHNNAQPGTFVRRDDAPQPASLQDSSGLQATSQSFTPLQTLDNGYSSQNGFTQSSTNQQTQHINDDAMDTLDAPNGPSAHSIPSGPKSMRHSAHPGRGGRMNKTMNRSPNMQLHRIKGTANAGRINTHSKSTKGPRGGGRFGAQLPSRKDLNPNSDPSQTLEDMNPQQKLFMQTLMEQNFQLMAMMQMPQPSNAGGGGGGGGGGFNGNGGAPQFGQPAQSLFDRVDSSTSGNMKVPYTDADRESAWKSICKQNLFCTFVQCPYAHQSPAAPPGTKVDLEDTCPHGAECKNRKCAAKHPSPSSGSSYQGPPPCKYHPYCTNQYCKFYHPVDDGYPCENGADCTLPNCSRQHIQVACKYNPCTNPICRFKHEPGQKSGVGARDAMRGKATWINPEWKNGASISAVEVPQLEVDGQNDVKKELDLEVVT